MFKFRVVGIAIGGLLVVVAGWVAFAIAIGGDDSKANEDRVLQMRGYDITEEHFKTYLQSEVILHNTGWEPICASFLAKSDEEALAIARAADNTPISEQVLPPHATPVDREHSPDGIRGIQILKEVCREEF